MSTEILQPFQLTASGAVATTSDPRQQGEQHIHMLVVTGAGERVMLGNYGVGIAGLVFAPDDGFFAQQVSQAVETQMALWEPTLVLAAVKTIADSQAEGIASIDVEWSLMPSSALSTTNTATINVGGTVVEVTQ